VLWLGRRMSEEAVIEGAASRGVRVYGVSGYFLKKPVRAGILLGYSRMSESQIREGIRRLSEVV
jgi:DNA-binding transcriptional MocR family regulator